MEISHKKRNLCPYIDQEVYRSWEECEFGGVERWNGTVEWTTGVDYWTGLLECHAHKCTVHSMTAHALLTHRLRLPWLARI